MISQALLIHFISLGVRSQSEECVQNCEIRFGGFIEPSETFSPEKEQNMFYHFKC